MKNGFAVNLEFVSGGMGGGGVLSRNRVNFECFIGLFVVRLFTQ